METQNRKTLAENRNTNPNTEISIPNRKHAQSSKKTKLNHKTETESKNTNHSQKRRKQKQGNSEFFSIMFHRFFFFWTGVLRFFFRGNMIAGYCYLGTLNCKSISFPGYLFSPLPVASRSRWPVFSSLRCPCYAEKCNNHRKM